MGQDHLLESVVTQARIFAVRAHVHQRYGTRPYIYHLDHTAGLLADAGYQRERVVAYLHDVLEDTPTPIDDIIRVFGLEVAAACNFCTDEVGLNRAERKKRTHIKQKRMVQANPPWITVAVRVKVADRISNVQNTRFSELRQMYKDEHEGFKDALYIPGMCDSLWDLLDKEWVVDALVRKPKGGSNGGEKNR